MRMNASRVLCALISALCLLTSNQQIYLAQTASTTVQRCPDDEQFIITQESGRSLNSWRGLMPLKSTRRDVEQLIGKASWSQGSTFIYELACGRLNVVYSKGSCKLTQVQRWNVPQDVLIKMEFAPGSLIRVKDLNLPTDHYTRQQQLHPQNWVEYRNKEDGILINALLDKKGDTVAVITYQPTRTQEELFLCPPRRTQ